MPMDFPDLQSLERIADIWKFRKINEGESEDSYRSALADFVAPHDFVESQEIRCKKGWDKWSERDGLEMLMRAFERPRRY